jgi:hypothetical protein
MFAPPYDGSILHPCFIGLMAYFLKYIHTASANKTIVAIQRDESLIPVFLAMGAF